MPLTEITCPECFAKLKSAAGYTPGKSVTCRKCETPFRVADPDAGGAAGEAPRRRVRATAEGDEGDERSYKSSPLRFVILGVLVLVMIGLGAALYLKKQGEADDERAEAEQAAADKAAAEKAGNGPANPNGRQPGGRLERKGGNPKGQNAKGPIAKGPANKEPNATPLGIGLGGLAGAGGLDPARAGQLQKAFAAKLVGTWAADLGGKTEERTYAADGSFTVTPSEGEPVSGKYEVKQAVGDRTFKVQLDGPGGPRTLTVTVEGDELNHPTLQPGVTGSFRKKADAAPADPDRVAPAPRPRG